MSLKAKLEAVIYAAEEPVTLAQLAMIFADEALAWRAEVEAAAKVEASEMADFPVNEAFDYADTNSEPPAEPLVEAESVSEPEKIEQSAGQGAEQIEGGESDPLAEGAEQEETEHSTLDPVAEARRAARQRDKEVRTILRTLLDEIVAAYASESHGIEIREIAGGFRMGTKPEFHDSVRAFIKSQKPAMKLSLPALETLAVVAYKQPVTAPEVNEIRGVDSSGVFGSLLARKLIATAGRKQVIGRPILYKTTKEFLLRFGLKDLAELPSMEEFEKMAASEFDEAEMAESQESSSNATLSPEFDENASEEEFSDDGTKMADVASPESPDTHSESNPSETAPPGAE